MQKIEIVTLVIFIVFILFPFRIPSNLAKIINHPIGFLVIFIIIVFLFLKAHPILAFVYLLVAYELVRRSGDSVTPKGAPSQSYSSQSHKTSKSKVQMNPLNGTPELNNTDKNYVNNVDNNINYDYSRPSYTSNPNDLSYQINYGSIGVNSNEEERKKQMVTINPQESVGNTLEEDIIRNRVPANGMHPSSVAEQSSYSPVYDNAIYGSSI